MGSHASVRLRTCVYLCLSMCKHAGLPIKWRSVDRDQVEQRTAHRREARHGGIQGGAPQALVRSRVAFTAAARAPPSQSSKHSQRQNFR